MKNRDSFIDAFYKLQNYDPKVIGPLIDEIDEYLGTNGPDTKLELLSLALKTQKEIMRDNDFIKACKIASLAVDILQDADWDLFELDIFINVLGRIESYELATSMMKKAHDTLDSKFSDLEFYDYMKFKIFAESSARHLRTKFYDNADPKKVKEMFDTCVNSAIEICEKHGYITFRTVQLTFRAIFEEDVKKILDCAKAIEETKDEYWITVIKNKVAEYTKHLGDNVTTKLKNYVIGWQVKKRRQELGITSMDFADMIKTNQNIVNKMERGNSGVSQKRLYAIAAALSVNDIGYFLGGPINRTTDIYLDLISHLISPLSDNSKENLIELIRVHVNALANK